MENIVKVVRAGKNNPYILTKDARKLDLKRVCPEVNESVQTKLYEYGFITRDYPHLGVKVSIPRVKYTPLNWENSYHVDIEHNGGTILDAIVDGADGKITKIERISPELMNGEIKLPNSAKRLLKKVGEYMTKVR